MFSWIQLLVLSSCDAVQPMILVCTGVAYDFFGLFLLSSTTVSAFDTSFTSNYSVAALSSFLQVGLDIKMTTRTVLLLNQVYLRQAGKFT